MLIAVNFRVQRAEWKEPEVRNAKLNLARDAHLLSIARRLLKSLSIKQGIKYDSPASAADIPAFIQFHNLKVEEILDPLESFSEFTSFLLPLLYRIDTC